MLSALKAGCVSSLLFLSAAALCSRYAAGQGSVAGQNGLTRESRAVIDTLSSLGELPDGVWKMHIGDMPHGEASELDEASWEPVLPDKQEPIKLPTEAVWFRQTYEIPATLHGYDLTGARIWFQLRVVRVTTPILPQIIYFNGRRVAMGENLEPIVLVDHAQPGERISVAVKLLEGPNAKYFQGANLRVNSPEGRPNPLDLCEEFQTAELLIPSLSSEHNSSLAALNDAVQIVDLAALQAHNQEKFDASLQDARRKLETLRPLVQQVTFHLTGNSHIDAAWLWPWTESIDVVRRTFSSALQLMYEYPGFTFTQSSAAYNEWMADKYPDLNDEISKRVKEGRWEIVGGMWVEPDLNMPCGESLVRQLLIGTRWYKKTYGVSVRVGWNPDSFGYSWQLPQIYKRSGIDYFVTQKLRVNDTNQYPFKLFWWESPDGSKILTYFPHTYNNRNLDPIRLSQDFVVARDLSPGLSEMMDLYGVGDHGGGPTRYTLDEGFHWAAPGQVTPKYQFGTAQSFFESVKNEIAPESPVWNYESIAKGYTPPSAVQGKISIPTWDSELYLEYHRGTYTTQANMKHNMRTSEEEVLNAEKLASLAWLEGDKYPGPQLTDDWKKVLFNQFHDLLAGSGVADIYKDAQKDYEAVRWSTNEIRDNAMRTLEERIDTESRGENLVPIVIFNPLGWAHGGEVTVSVQPPRSDERAYRIEGNGADSAATVTKRDPATGVVTLSIPIAQVPALGYKVIWVDLSPTSVVRLPQETESESKNSFVLENRFLRVAIDKSSGCITSLYDKAAKFESVAAGSCGNELQAFNDLPKKADAWNIDPGTLEKSPALLTDALSVAAVGTRAVRVTRVWQNSKFIQTVSLSPGTDQVDVDNQIDWHEHHVLLKAAFPVAATSGFATYEIPFGTIERPTTRNNSWEKARFEVPALRWADLGDGKHGLSVLNEDKYGYDAVGNLLRLTLLRAPTYPDPEADQGRHHFRYALYPHTGTWKDALTVRHGWEYDYPLMAFVTTAHAGSLPAEHSFVSVYPSNVVLTAVKKAEDSDGIILRVYEWAGNESTVVFHVPSGATSATVTNLMETPRGSRLSVDANIIRVPIHPYEILTIRVDYPPV